MQQFWFVQEVKLQCEKGIYWWCRQLNTERLHKEFSYFLHLNIQTSVVLLLIFILYAENCPFFVDSIELPLFFPDFPDKTIICFNADFEKIFQFLINLNFFVLLIKNKGGFKIGLNRFYDFLGELFAVWAVLPFHFNDNIK